MKAGKVIMVFFTCNACGESLKKNAVEKHYRNKCRNCEVLTCIDCHKVRCTLDGTLCSNFPNDQPVVFI